MKKLLLCFIISFLSFGQTKDELDLCMAIQGNNFSTNAAADNALNRILNTIGASKNFVLTPCDKISNAVATAYKGTRYILYDRDFMKSISRGSNDWSSLFILAHEVGHHINGHSIDILLYAGDVVDSPSLEKKRKQELEADEFAAFILAKLGAKLSQLNNVISLISDNSDDTYSTHPNRLKRLLSVEKGYKKANVRIENNSKNTSFFSVLMPKNNIDFNTLARNDNFEMNGKNFMSDKFELGGRYDSSPKLLIEFGVLNNGGSLLNLSAKMSYFDVFVKGELIFILDNGDKIICIDRGSRIRKDNEIFSHYYLSKNEVEMLSKINLKAVSFELSDGSNSYRYGLNNLSKINANDISRLFGLISNTPKMINEQNKEQISKNDTEGKDEKTMTWEERAKKALIELEEIMNQQSN